MGKASIWKSKALGRFVSMLGAFPVHRGTADRESLRTCLEVIENGEPLVMFPEGTRRSGDGSWTSSTARRTSPPAPACRWCPVGIGGSDAAMPVGAKFVRPHKIVLVVGDPIDPPPGDGSGRVKRRVVRELTDAAPGRGPGPLRRGPAPLAGNDLARPRPLRSAVEHDPEHDRRDGRQSADGAGRGEDGGVSRTPAWTAADTPATATTRIFTNRVTCHSVSKSPTGTSTRFQIPVTTSTANAGQAMRL